MGWLQEHLETFVKPVLGEVPALSKDDKPFFSPQEMAVIKNMWRSVKTEAKRLKKPILLAGRDVFIFEILARREGVETVFRPDISRLTAMHIREDYSKHFLFDTGFMGSIPRALRCEAYTMGSANAAEAATKGYGSMYLPRYMRKSEHVMLRIDTKQVFPRMRGARSLILKIERTPKYWRRGFYREFCRCSCMDRDATGICIACGLPAVGGIKQELSLPAEFTHAAKLTIQIYKDSSPSFIDKPVDVTGIYDNTLYLD
jgi:hypothetical protein